MAVPFVEDRAAHPGAVAGVTARSRRVLPAERVVTDLGRLRTHECDGSAGYRVVPGLVVLPETTEEVSVVVGECYRAGVPFVARGAGTGLSGGALPVADGVVVSLARVRRVLGIDVANQRTYGNLRDLVIGVTLVLAARQPAFTPAVGPRRRRVGMLSGCVQRVFFGDVNAAATRVLAAEGCNVVAPAQQQCCGALSSHAGREEEAIDRAKALIDSFADADVEDVVVNVAGCGSAMKEYGHLLRDEPGYAERAKAFSAKVRDVSELLHEIGPVAERHPVRARVAYHDACHLGHAQKITAQPRAVLRGVPEMTVLDIPETEFCCGSAGIYNLVQPEPAEELGRRKVAQIATTAPDAVVTGNAGCLLQIRRYLDAGVPLFHPVQLVDASIRGVDPITAARRRSPRCPSSPRSYDGVGSPDGDGGATTGAMPADVDSGAVDVTGADPLAVDPFADEGR